MEDLVERLAGGHVTAVKVVLTTVVTALAVYQVVLMAVGYGKLRLPFLRGDNASVAHRTIGDVIVTLVIVVGVACLAYFGVEDSVEEGTPGPDVRAVVHVVASFALVAVLALKLLVLHVWRRLDRALPYLGVGVLVLLAVTWASSAGAILGP